MRRIVLLALLSGCSGANVPNEESYGTTEFSPGVRLDLPNPTEPPIDPTDPDPSDPSDPSDPTDLPPLPDLPPPPQEGDDCITNESCESCELGCIDDHCKNIVYCDLNFVVDLCGYHRCDSGECVEDEDGAHCTW